MEPSTSLMPHAVCWASAPRLIWTMVVTNLITFLSYVSICATLLWLVRKTGRVIARDWAWFSVGFALFIVACGSTHLLEVITTWTPIFWVDAATNIVTAALSALVAFLFIRRSTIISFSINDYADRLADTENEKRKMESSLLAARKLEDVSRISSVISHEIGNPLEAIQNLLYLIRTTEGVSTEVKDLAATAADEATRVLTISRATLSVFRDHPAPEPVDLTLAAESVRFLVSGLARVQNLTIDVASTGDTVVQSFPGEVRQILLNLVRNACEATERPGAHVSITLTPQREGVGVVVADQGTGMPPAMLESLYQFGRSTKGQAGNGMGLWTVQHLLMRHGGSIQVASTVGEGTRFILFWPWKYTAPATPEIMASAAA